MTKIALNKEQARLFIDKSIIESEEQYERLKKISPFLPRDHVVYYRGMEKLFEAIYP